MIQLGRRASTWRSSVYIGKLNYFWIFQQSSHLSALGVVAMLRRLDQLLSTQPPASLALFSFLLVAVIGAADYLTGNELSFSVFYLIPVALGSWYLRGRFGLLVCMVSAATWLVVDYTSGNLHMHPAILLWNTGVRFGFFLVVATLLRRLRSALELQASLAQLDELTGLLNARAFKQRCSDMFELCRSKSAYTGTCLP